MQNTIRTWIIIKESYTDIRSEFQARLKKS